MPGSGHIGIGVGIDIDIDFFLMNEVQLELLGAVYSI
jgi:hypothetical protein